MLERCRRDARRINFDFPSKTRLAAAKRQKKKKKNTFDEKKKPFVKYERVRNVDSAAIVLGPPINRLRSLRLHARLARCTIFIRRLISLYYGRVIIGRLAET